MPTKNTRILGIDLGLHWTGLAVSDELGISTRALPDLEPKSRKADIDSILRLCAELNIGVVLIGYPALASGDEGIIGRRAHGFFDALKKTIAESQSEIAVHLVDETYTSKFAAKRLFQTGLNKKKRRAAIHGESARILVEDYLSANQSQAVI